MNKKIQDEDLPRIREMLESGKSRGKTAKETAYGFI